MLYRKTEKGRQLLQSHDGSLDLRERRVLIMCDGQRDQAALDQLFNEDLRSTLQRLQALGLLEGDASVARPAPAAARSAPASMRPAAPASAPAAAPAPPSQPAPAGNTRRSLVAAKMYMLDMLALQRGDEANALRLQLQVSREPEAMLNGFAAALRFMENHAAMSIVERMRQRLLEVLPEEYLPALAAAQA